MNYTYIIKWLGTRNWEEIDETNNRAEAKRLVQEYNLAFHGGSFKIIKKETTNWENKNLSKKT